jgi:prolyl oligopeptidase
MKNTILNLAILFFIPHTTNAQWKYPETKTVDSSDTFWGQHYKDPYRWLEDLNDSNVSQWFKGQANYTINILAKISGREQLIKEFEAIDRITTVNYGIPVERNGLYFFLKRRAGEEKNKLYIRATLNGKDRLLFDPEQSFPGQSFIINQFSASSDAKEVLVALTKSGSEIETIYILHVADKQLSPEKITQAILLNWVAGIPGSFLYMHLQTNDAHAANLYQDITIKLHSVGTSTTADREMFGRIHSPELKLTANDYPEMYTYENSSSVVVNLSFADNTNDIYYASRDGLKTGVFNWKPLCKRADKIRNFIVINNDAYLRSYKTNSGGTIIKLSLTNPDIKNPQIVIDTKAGNTLGGMRRTKDYLVVQQNDGVNWFITKTSLTTDKTVRLYPHIPGSFVFRSFNEYSSNQGTAFNFAWTEPSNYYHINLENDSVSRSAFFVESKYPGLQNLITEEIEIDSYDGVKVPLSIVYDKTMLKKDGSNICLLEGYGAYGISTTPIFRPSFVPLMQRGVVLAFAHVRGGGEKGEAWHYAGMKTTKPNTWKDFISCAEYLISNQYTSHEHIAATAGSAGGILLGRTITERPDLLKAAVIDVGALNALRLEFYSNGVGNAAEFGTLKDSVEAKALYEMDAYQHINVGTQYPATLITTGYNDPRVASWMPAKFAARLQAANSSALPVLLRVDYKTGHFAGEGTKDKFINEADRYAFILWQCGHKDFELQK